MKVKELIDYLNEVDMGTEVFICCKGEGELLEIDSIDIEDDDLNPGKRIVILYEE